ncbi:MAG: MBL fold metallo-hydrolase [Muribaculaceae bacterium]|nr:MBL fold metallo-hydrolase [Muribaculaceae bacterium]MDE5958236.1 MBL fold metallo-hydrolase [Muribaculaceae bacterium]MDE6448202.1 MBL fold metallo-hydrolase [Muribaculaceae bacterium]MDE7343949.1 MBL fold metallo-hydrolase [Muribaculaceae bacterium]
MARRRTVINFVGQMTIPFEEFNTLHSIPPPAESERQENDNPATRVINYISFGSGSSGNCCYVGTRHGGFLVDAGVNAEEVTSQLKANGLRMEQVKGILLTHDHSDHVKYAYTLLRTNKHMRLFCTNRVLNGLLRRHGISKRIKDYHVPIFKEIPFKLASTEITAFDVPHDGTDNMGFSINYDNRNFVIATDLGAITERAHYYMSRANYLVIEANYDLQMLLHGPYPEYLKARIRTERGHLDNVDTAAFLKEVWSPDLKYVFLCHLSKDNNTPSKALKAVREALESRGAKIGDGEETLHDRQSDLQLIALPRFEPTRWYVFRP